MIESYKPDGITVNGKTYTNDLKVINERITGSWRRKDSSLLQVDDVRDVLNSDVKLLIVGTGNSECVVISKELRNELASRNIYLITKPTKSAQYIYNRIDRTHTAAVFHLT